ncbi:MAG TPA: TldD/PmbA family protein [Actinomycetota bacterium]|nr:TldD/PmbA family protein [Actinomycetota bacterium]
MRGLPVTHDEARDAARSVLAFPGADGVEVVVAGSTTGLTRYASSRIIQNTSRDELRAYVRVIVGSRVASAGTNQLDAEHMKRAAQRALDAARSSMRDDAFPGLADPGVVGRPEPTWRWDETTAGCSPAARADSVGRIFSAIDGLSAAGVYETSAHAFGIFTSSGIDCFDGYTRCIATCLADGGGSTGWGEDSSHALDDVDVEAVAARAVTKAQPQGEPSSAEPGDYEVILEPPAAATLIEYLSYMGFGAKQVIEGDSFLVECGDQQVAVDGVTIADDVAHPRSVGIAFDFEGVPRRRVAVIDEGRATRPVTDLRTSKRLGLDLTGHSSGSDEVGPFASNVVLDAGTSSAGELIGAVSDGLLVTRFHYVNILDRPATLLTGMTRDGTFRIRNGEVAEPVHNLRFAQSVLEALGAVRGIGRDLHSFAPDYGSFGSTVVPALHIGAFHFGSTTSH